MKASKEITWYKSGLHQKPVRASVPQRKCHQRSAISSSVASAGNSSSVTSADNSSSSPASLMPYYVAFSAVGLVLYGIFTLFQGPTGLQTSMSDECHYLSHLGLAGQYQQQKDGSARCQSQVRYLGANNQHTLRYMAKGSEGTIEEMRVSLRLGEYGQAGAIDELIRFGQSLSLPVLGHTMPPDVGQYLRDGHVGHWDFSRASLYIERHHYPVQRATASSIEARDFEDIELVFRKNRVH